MYFLNTVDLCPKYFISTGKKHFLLKKGWNK